MDAFAQVYSEHHKLLSNYLKHFDPVYYEDIAQDTWIKAHQQLDKFAGGSFTAWLLTIGKNICIDRKRLHEVEPFTWDGDLPDIFDKIDFEILPPLERQIIGYLLLGVTLSDVTILTGINNNTVLGAYSRAIVRIRKDLINRHIIDDLGLNLDISRPRIYRPK